MTARGEDRPGGARTSGGVSALGPESQSRRRGRGHGGGRGGRGEQPMVPPAEFTSYYGRPVVKPSPWTEDIPVYLFLGGVAGGSSLLAAGGDLTGRPALRRGGRLVALVGITVSLAALVRDLGRPERFLNMLRVVKPTSPMSVGTWLLTAYGPLVGLAAGAELLPERLRRRLPFSLVAGAARPAGVGAALLAPGVASYTAVLLSQTSTPTWHDAHRELPFVFVGSAAAASGGVAMVLSPVDQAGPARRLAVGGALLELAVERRMERGMGLTAEPLHTGHAGRLMRAATLLTTVGAAGAAVAARLPVARRPVSVAAGVALAAGSACLRFGVFEAGQESARDPRYTVVPQRARLTARTSAAPAPAPPDAPR